MKRLIFITVIMWGCSESKPTYNLETLGSDISSFSAYEQTELVNFSTQYEQTKSFQDSIKGAPVVLVPSLTYSEILDYIRNNQQRLLTLDSLNYIKILNSVEQNSNDSLNGTSVQRWVISENFLEQTGLMLAEGRNFSTAFNDEKSIIVSESLASKLELEIGDNIELEGSMRVIGVLAKLPTNYPTDQHMIVAELKN